MLKIYILIILLSFSFETYSQVSSSTLLNSEFIKSKNLSLTNLKYILAIDSTMKVFDESHRKEIERYFQAEGNIDSFKYDFSQTVNMLKKYFYSDYDLIIKQFAAFNLYNFSFTKFKIEQNDLKFAKDCLDILKADDLIWSLNPEAVLYFTNLYTNLAIMEFINNKETLPKSWSQEERNNFNDILLAKYLSYGNDLYYKNPNREVKAHSLIYMLQMLRLLKKEDIASEYYYKLSSEFLDIEVVKRTLIEYNPEGNLIPGKHIPQFKAKLLKSMDVITSNMLRGKNYLIYFWATWCPPCVMKMEKLHKVYEKYKNSNFTIVSFSLDSSDEIVNKFQKEKWEMPWYNVRLREGFNDEISKKFELNGGVPKMFLVDSTGVIVGDNITIKDDYETTIENMFYSH